MRKKDSLFYLKATLFKYDYPVLCPARIFANGNDIKHRIVFTLTKDRQLIDGKPVKFYE